MANRIRRVIYVKPEHRAGIADLATRRRTSESAVVEAAIAAFLAPEGTERFEAAVFALRLDRIERDLRRLERHAIITAETLALYMRSWLTVTPAVPPAAQAAAQAKGRARYRAFMTALKRRLKEGRSLVNDVRDEAESQEAESQEAESQQDGRQRAEAADEPREGA